MDNMKIEETGVARRQPWSELGDVKSWLQLVSVAAASALTLVSFEVAHLIAVGGTVATMTLTATVRAERKRRLSLCIIGIGFFAVFANTAILVSTGAL